jgi:serine beta-lactamase-like protein LACTB
VSRTTPDARPGRPHNVHRRHAPRPLRGPLLAALAALAVAGTAAPPPIAAQVATAAARGADLASRLERVADMLATHQDTSGVVGLSAAVAYGGRLVWAGGFGYADLQHRVEAGPGMVSRIGSISKPIAAVAALTLLARDRLDLDAPIATYLPDYPASNARITMRQLMSHTAGVRHYRGDEFASNVTYRDVHAPLAVFAADSLEFEPGTDYRYSTYGWTVVSAVTQAADGDRPWVRILREEVVEPLGLVSLQPEWQDSVIPGHASFYVRTGDGAVLNAPEVDLSNKWAGGGLVATASDLVNFALGVMQGGVLSDAARAEMWSRQTGPEAPAYGLGWRVGEHEGRRMVSHSGGSMGATAMLVFLPDEGIAVAVLGNTGGVSHAAIARRAAAALMQP